MFRDLRRKDKRMDKETTLDLLEKAEVGVLSTLGKDGYPYGVALNYVYLNQKIYFHCAKDGHKLDNINYHDKVSFSIYDDVQIKGKALRTYYRSLVVFGKARIIEADENILLALVLKYADLNENMARNMIRKEIDVTALVEIDIDHISGKIGNK